MLIVPQHTPKHVARPKVAVFASGSGSNFDSIAKHVQQGQLNIELACLVCNKPDAFVLQRAEAFDVPTVLLNHQDYPNREAHDRAIIEAIKAFGVEWIIMAGWMRIVSPLLIEAFEGRVLNIHPSLLPSFKGLRAVEQAWQAGVKITGCTVHFVVPEMDAGPIVGQAAVPVLEDDTLETLQHRIHSQEHLLYPRAIAQAIASFGARRET